MPDLAVAHACILSLALLTPFNLSPSVDVFYAFRMIQAALMGQYVLLHPKAISKLQALLWSRFAPSWKIPPRSCTTISLMRCSTSWQKTLHHDGTTANDTVYIKASRATVTNIARAFAEARLLDLNLARKTRVSLSNLKVC